MFNLFDKLTRIFSRTSSLASFEPQKKRGFIVSRWFEDLPETSVIPVGKFKQVALGVKTSIEFATLPVYEVDTEPDFDTLALVHDQEYLDDLLNFDLTPRIVSSEIPLTYEILQFFLYSTAATIAAVECAYRSGGVYAALSGGFHHAYSDHAEGFCYLNDVAIAVEKFIIEHKQKNAQSQKKVLIIDLDLHQGNGISAFFENRKDVFVFSIHQSDNYPTNKEKSHLDVGLPSGTGGKTYLKALRRSLRDIEQQFIPDLAVYLAGADPYEKDMLGDFQLTKKEMRIRDRMVHRFLVQRQIPYALVLAGGYAHKTADVVSIHMNTLKTAMKR